MDDEDVIQLGLWLSSVRRYEHRAGQPDPEHGEDELGSVGQLDDHRLARLDPGGTQLSADSGGFRPRGASRDGPIHGVDQVFTVGEGMCRQQVRQAARGLRHDPALPREGRSAQASLSNNCGSALRSARSRSGAG